MRRKCLYLLCAEHSPGYTKLVDFIHVSSVNTAVLQALVNKFRGTLNTTRVRSSKNALAQLLKTNCRSSENRFRLQPAVLTTRSVLLVRTVFRDVVPLLCRSDACLGSSSRAFACRDQRSLCQPPPSCRAVALTLIVFLSGVKIVTFRLSSSES